MLTLPLKYGLGVCLDFQKVFDTVEHDILVCKLHHWGIREKILMWFKRYLKYRKEVTAMNGIFSQTSPSTQ